ncbi:hypothetical protein TK90_2057 [Thioalkalivibrio sp. K90mix]|uniref:phage holin family protein n=1 Tax=unclassified Thioalkalivibrio TaxID=2621013 RepID=UPI00019597AE|nr:MULTISPECIES: phage holin family protein [unclassified Thioalkalivibrio]ADC72548.1 hypothetical protein TK90_2057 [Thioalkalivibrio sp. K90mix]
MAAQDDGPARERSDSDTADPGDVMQDLGRILGDSRELLGTETRQLVRNAVGVIVFAVVLGLLLVTVWLALVAAVVMLLQAYAGVSPALSLVIVAALTGVLAWLVARGIGRLLHGMTYPETRALVRNLVARPESRDTE